MVDQNSGIDCVNLTLRWPDIMYFIEIKKYRFNVNSASAQTVYFHSNSGSTAI